jgi:hypothetical protein
MPYLAIGGDGHQTPTPDKFFRIVVHNPSPRETRRLRTASCIAMFGAGSSRFNARFKAHAHGEQIASETQGLQEG